MIRPLAPFRMRPIKTDRARKLSSHAIEKRIAADATSESEPPVQRRSLAVRKPLRAPSPLKAVERGA